MERNVQLAPFAATAELIHGHRSLVKMIDGYLLMAKIDGSRHLVGEVVWQFCVAEKCPAAEVDAANVAGQFRIVFARQHGVWKANPSHMLYRIVVDREETHARLKRDRTPAFYSFVEDGI